MQPCCSASLAVGQDAVTAWVTYVTKCDDLYLGGKGRKYDPKVTTPEACGGFSGNLCIRKDVKCSKDTTDFLDASGKVIATGKHKELEICYVGGKCEAPAVP